MCNEKFDNPKKARRRPLLLRILLSAMLMPFTLVIGGFTFGGNGQTNPLMSDGGEPSEGEPAPAPEGGTPGGQAAPAAPQPQGGTGHGEPAPAPQGQGAEGGSAPTQTPTSSVVEKLKAAGVNKFNDDDGFVKSYINIEKLNSQLGQQNAQLKQQLENVMRLYQETVKNMPAQQNNTQNVNNQPQQPTPEELEKMNSDFLEQLMSDPIGTLTKFFTEKATPLVTEKLKPMEEFRNEFMTAKTQLEWNNKVNAFATEKDENGNLLRPDFAEIWPEMLKVFEAVPGIVNEPNVLDFAYKYAKGSLADQPGNVPAVDPQQLLKDETFVRDFILKNQDIVNAVLQNHLKGIKNGQPPAVMSSNNGGQPLGTPAESPKDLSAATRLWKQAMGLISR